MNELQLFRLGNDTLEIARLTKQTEAAVYFMIHFYRQEEHRESRKDHERLMRYRRENRRFGVGR